MDWLVTALQECCCAAQPLGVRLALEPINRYETSLINNVDQGIELVEHIGVENFGLLLDTFHMNIEESQIEASIHQCGERIFHFHVADSNRWYPGAGHLDFKIDPGSPGSHGLPGLGFGRVPAQAGCTDRSKRGDSFFTRVGNFLIAFPGQQEHQRQRQESKSGAGSKDRAHAEPVKKHTYQYHNQ